MNKTYSLSIVLLFYLPWAGMTVAVAQDDGKALIVEEQQEGVIMMELVEAVQRPVDPRAAKERLPDELRPLMKAELFFMFMVIDVDVDAETKQKIRDASEVKLKEMIDLLNSGGEAFNNFNGGFAGGQVVAQTSSGLSLKANPYTRVREDAKKIAAELLEAPQNEKYVLECDKRDAFEREAVVASVVAMLDKKLFFSDDQRSAISEELTKNWAKAFDVNLETYQNSPAYVPDIPFVRIDKILNRDQRKLWQGLQKYTFPIVIGTEQQPVEWDE